MFSMEKRYRNKIIIIIIIIIRHSTNMLMIIQMNQHTNNKINKKKL